MKNTRTNTFNNPALEDIPVEPTDRMQINKTESNQPVLDLIDKGLRNRPELLETDVDLVNRQISRKAARNALLPSLSLVGFYGGTGLAGLLNPVFAGTNSSNVPTDLVGAWQSAFNNSSPDYFIGLNLNIPFRNRVAKADQYRSELEYRQAGLRKEQLKKQIRIEVRNAQYALEKTRARGQAATKVRDLATASLEITKKEATLGAGSGSQ